MPWANPALDEVMERPASLRQHERDGRRSPHKPLLVLLALGRLANEGSSSVPWSVAEERLGDLIAEFQPPSGTGRAQSAAYPFTRLRRDGVWTLDEDVQDDRFSSSVRAIRPSPRLRRSYQPRTAAHGGKPM